MVAGARCIALKVDTLHSEALRYKSSLCRYNITSSIIRTGACNRRHISIFARQEANNKNGNCISNSNGDVLMESRLKVSEWQSSCAILNSQLQIEAKEAVEGDDLKALVRSDRAGSVDSFGSKDVVPLPRALSMADLDSPLKDGSQLRVAFKGMLGAYSEAAAGKAYPGSQAIPCDQFEEAFQAVELWDADRAVLPIEDLLGGSIHRNYDLLLRHRLHIVGEVQLPVHHCLMALPGTRKEDLRRVISHPQALAQCEDTISKLVDRKVVREAVYDTAGAAQIVAENNLRDTAAIASARAAEIYGLNIIADGIQDNTSNVTRFVMLAREPIMPRVDRPFKTSIVFAQDEGVGILFRVLSAFAYRDITLSKIESRPHRNRPLRVVDDSNWGTVQYFQYLSYIDFEASMADPRAQNALAKLQEFTNFLRVLGSYPMDTGPLNNSHVSF